MAKMGRPRKERPPPDPRLSQPVVGPEFTEQEAQLIAALAAGEVIVPHALGMARWEYLKAVDDPRIRKAVLEFWGRKLFLMSGKAVIFCERAMDAQGHRDASISVARQKTVEMVLKLCGFDSKKRLDDGHESEALDELNDMQVVKPKGGL